MEELVAESADLARKIARVVIERGSQAPELERLDRRAAELRTRLRQTWPHRGAADDDVPTLFHAPRDGARPARS